MEEALKLDDADQWILAELSEKQSWDAHDVVEIVPRSVATSRGKRVFKAKPVLKKKFHPPDAEHPEGRLDKYKMRLANLLLIRECSLKELITQTNMLGPLDGAP